MKTFVFCPEGDSDNSVSVVATVKAYSLEHAKACLLESVREREEDGGPDGVIGIRDHENCRVHVRIPHAAIANDNNWEEDE